MPAFRVLHVDDEPDIREIVEISLCLDPDIDVRCCASGKEAVAAAAEWSPDIVLLDVVMPDMDGPATLTRLRESPLLRDVPIVFMTARVQPREADHFRAMGAAGIISKPFDPFTLAGAVKRHLHDRAAPRHSPGRTLP